MPPHCDTLDGPVAVHRGPDGGGRPPRLDGLELSGEDAGLSAVPHYLSRREALIAGGIAAGSIYLGLRNRTASGARKRGHVIVVGAGLAGLSAAYQLERSDWSVTVLEARDRIGGRTHTFRSYAGGQVAEAGGEYVDSGHTKLRSFARRFGLRLDDVRHSEDRYEDVAYVRGRFRNYEVYAGGEVEREMDRFYETVYNLAEPINPDNPAAAGASLDRRSVADLIEELGIRGRSREVLNRCLRDDYAIEPARISLLFLVTAEKVGFGQSDRGVEAFRVRGGNDQLARGFARRLERQPHLGSPVTAVRIAAGKVRVTAKEEEIEADRVLLAAPLPGLRRVRFSPALPEVLRAAIREVQYGAITKTPLQYERRFWHQRGFSGDTYTDMPLSTTWEATDRQRGRRGILMTYASGDDGLAAARLGEAKRINRALAQLERIYPGSRGLFAGTQTVAWSNSPFNGGAYCAFAPGQVSDFWIALRRSYGRIHLAGEHTANFTGYMEGAIRSGLAAAREIDRAGPA